MLTAKRHAWLAPISLLVALLLVSGCARFNQRPQTSPAQDRAVEKNLEDDYMKSEILGKYLLDADITNGVAYVAGKVNVQAERELALEMARGTAGVYKVEDRILVASEATGEERRTGTVFSDSTITATVKSRLLINSDVSGWKINVDTRAGKVTLNGYVYSAAEKALAEEIARNSRGVQSVKNNLEIRSRSSN